MDKEFLLLDSKLEYHLFLYKQLSSQISSIRKFAQQHKCLDTTSPCRWTSSTVTSILNNRTYLGHMPGLWTSTLSYKNMKVIYHDESEQILVKNTHEALITQEQWDMVQELRQRKKRTPKQMDEPNLFSGLVFCTDCGKPLVITSCIHDGCN